jgi:hypothetical protein
MLSFELKGRMGVFAFADRLVVRSTSLGMCMMMLYPA